jgi:hypothetical protein
VNLAFKIFSGLLVAVVFVKLSLHNHAKPNSLWQWFEWGFSGSGMQASMTALTSMASVFAPLLCVSWIYGKLVPGKGQFKPPSAIRIWRNLALVFIITLLNGFIFLPGTAVIVAILSFSLTVSSLSDLCIKARLNAESQ